jgi:hypothetical protein
MIGNRKEVGLVTELAASARKMAMEAGRHWLCAVTEFFNAERRTLSWRISRKLSEESDDAAAAAVAEVATRATAS